MTPLPVDDILPELIAAIKSHPSAVVHAPTGAGKTTRIPPALLSGGVNGVGQIVMVEPRRIAAQAAARRMAEEQGVRLGGEYGYQVRFDRCAGQETRLIVVTPGILLQRLHSDPYLEQVGLVIFDEFHERGLESDLALGFVRTLQQTVRPDLRLVAMSATLAADQVAKYLGDCPIIRSDGRLFPVTVRYEPKAPAAPPATATADAVRKLMRETPGDLLVFLPGWAEIRQTQRELESWAAERGFALLPLHGDLSPADQDAALGRLERRKIVLATNVAETSVTIDGVTGVVDSGLVRELTFDPAVGLDRLTVVPISRASADQRAGRAGRTQPGVCVRLWREGEHRGRPEHTTPELRRVDLAQAVLHLAAHGVSEPGQFAWFEPPPPAHLKSACELLVRLGAIDDDGRITSVGKTLSRLPVPPRLGAMLLAGAAMGQGDVAALAAAMLAERDPFRRWNAGDRPATDSDILDRIEILAQFNKTGQSDGRYGELDRGAARQVFRAADQLLRLVRDVPAGPAVGHEEALGRSLLAAFPDRVCRRRNPGGRKGVMVGGRGVRLDSRSSVTRPALFLAIDVDAGAGESVVRLASGIERDWLPSETVASAIEADYDDSAGRLMAWRRSRYFDLIIDESPTAAPEGEEARTALVRAMLARLDKIRPASDSPAGLFRTRVRCLRQWHPELNLPTLDDDDAREIVGWLASSCRSLAEFRGADWLAAYRSRLDYQQLAAIDREAPERLPLPSGRTAALLYEEGRPPVLSARIQDFFGLAETPTVGGGRVKVLLHLLAPNGRPQQVTDDLSSFWANTYSQVRKDLRGRYPKHAWPEDPRLSLE
ncbi:MAG: ATP-dependent helicase HrpB [Gemmataceae bacterium]|nr:ATP-dependent helicase HrpB [Gemmataceae bacterium]